MRYEDLPAVTRATVEVRVQAIRRRQAELGRELTAREVAWLRRRFAQEVADGTFEPLRDAAPLIGGTT